MVNEQNLTFSQEKCLFCYESFSKKLLQQKNEPFGVAFILSYLCQTRQLKRVTVYELSTAQSPSIKSFISPDFRISSCWLPENPSSFPLQYWLSDHGGSCVTQKPWIFCLTWIIPFSHIVSVSHIIWHLRDPSCTIQIHVSHFPRLLFWCFQPRRTPQTSIRLNASYCCRWEGDKFPLNQEDISHIMIKIGICVGCSSWHQSLKKFKLIFVVFMLKLWTHYISRYRFIPR